MHNKALLSQPPAAGTVHCVARPKAWRYAYMKKLVVLVAMLLLLTGCPPVLKGRVKNTSSHPIVMHSHHNYGDAVKIESSSMREMYWVRGCITVIENENQYFFSGEEIPEELIMVHPFYKALDILYESETLSYIGKEGQRVSLPKVVACKNA